MCSQALNMPFTRHITVHWGAMGVSDTDAARAITKLNSYVREALKQHGAPYSWVMVRENDNGDKTKGSHVHILAHVPADAPPNLLRLLPRWVRLAAGGKFLQSKKRVAGKPYAEGAVNTRRIGGSRHVAPAAHLANLSSAMDYILKGADDTARAQLGISRREEGGTVIGKRIGFSENIGPAAMRRLPAREQEKIRSAARTFFMASENAI